MECARGHPQGVLLRGCPRGWEFDARTRAPTRGAPTGCGCEGGSLRRVRGRRRGVAVRGCPRGWEFEARTRAPTRGDHTGVSAGVGVRRAYEGTHKGCPYGVWMRGWVFEARTRAPTRGAPTGCGCGGGSLRRVRGRRRGVAVRGDGRGEERERRIPRQLQCNQRRGFLRRIAVLLFRSYCPTTIGSPV